MTTRGMVSPGRVGFRTLIILTIVLAVCVVSFESAFGQPTNKQQAMQKRAAWLIGIAENQLGRGLYKETEITLLNAQQDCGEYLAAETTQKIDKLLDQARSAVIERQEIAELLQQSDRLIEQKKFYEAKERLELIKASKFLTKSERGHISESIKDIDKKISSFEKQIKKLFDQSVRFYKAGQLDEARIGFAKVADSGVKVASGGKSATDFVRLIDKTRGVPVKVTAPKKETITEKPTWPDIETIKPEVITPVSSDKVNGITSSITDLNKTFESYKRQVQILLDESVGLYEAGDYVQARAGFGKVIEAGVAVTSNGKTAQEYLKVLDEADVLQREALAALQLAEEQYAQGRFEETEKSLKQIQSEQSRYLPPSGRERLGGLVQKVSMTLAEREKISERLKASEALASTKNFAEAKAQLVPLINNPYLTGPERISVASRINKLEEQRLLALFEQSVALYKQGESNKAMPGLQEVAMAGAVFTIDGLMAQDYITKIMEPGTAVDRKPEVTISFEDGSPKEPAKPGEQGYVDFVLQKRNIQRSYTKAVVDDSVRKAEKYLKQDEFALAHQALAKAFSIINKNKLLLGDELYKSYRSDLTNLSEKISNEQTAYLNKKAEESRIKAADMARTIRDDVEQQRRQAVKDYMDNVYEFQKQQRYEEALGQLEQVIAIDPLNNHALTLKEIIEDLIRWRTQIEYQKEGQRQEMKALIDAQKESIPYIDKIRYLGAGDIEDPRNFKELVARRKEDDVEGRSPADMAVYKRLEEVVDLSALTEDMTLEEAFALFRDAVEPELPLIPLWNDLETNAFVEKEMTTIGISGQGLSNISLKTGLARVLQSVSSAVEVDVDLGYVIIDGTITIGTKETIYEIPGVFATRMYDISEIVGGSTIGGGYGGGGGGYGGRGGGGGGGYGGRGGGGYGGGGGGYGGGGGGYGGGGGGFGGGGFGGGGGGYGGGGFGGGGGGYGGGGGGYGGGGGGYGGGGGGGYGGRGGRGGGYGGGGGGNSYYKLYQLQEIMRQIQPDTWDLNYRGTTGGGGRFGSSLGQTATTTTTETTYGKGRIVPYETKALIITQTFEMHEEIRALLNKMKKLTDDQVSIETKFIVVDENFLEDIGVGVHINRLRIGGEIGTLTNIAMGSFNTVTPTGTSISSTLGGNDYAYTTNAITPLTGKAGIQGGFTLGGALDDLQVTFILRATQAHANSRVMTQPAITVVSGEMGMIIVQKQHTYIESSEFVTESTSAGVSGLRDVMYATSTPGVLPTGISLIVSPIITLDKKYVKLNISTNLEELIEAGKGLGQTIAINTATGELESAPFDLPLTESTMITTTVTVPDQGTLLLGGLTLTAEKESEAGAPILSKIPILGRLFSNRTETKDKQVLLILLKPTIILKDEAEENALAKMAEE